MPDIGGIFGGPPAPGGCNIPGGPGGIEGGGGCG
jgi:hypothetical protein